MKRIVLMVLALMISSLAFAKPQARESVVDSVATQADTVNYVRADELDGKIRQAVSEALANQENIRQRNYMSEIIDSVQNILIPFAGIAMPFAMSCIVVWIVISNETKRRRMKYNMMEKAIDKGVTIPEYVFWQPKQQRKKTNYNMSVALMSVGIALTLFFLIDGDPEVAALVSMLFLMGLGKLIVAILDDRKGKRADKAENEASVGEDNR